MASSSTTPPSANLASPTSPRQQKGAANASFTGELYSMYYNGVASIGKPPPLCKDDVPAWVLGRRFCASGGTTQWVNTAVGSISYFTYRNRLPQPLVGKLDHDAGWGCMIRTGQMMLAEALFRVFVAKVHEQQAAGGGAAVDEERTRRWVRNLFMDLQEAPFGVHAMALEGERHSIPVGTWLTPTALCRTVRELVIRQQFISAELTVVIGLDGGISHRDMSDALFLGGAVLALIPIMAGMRSVGKSYQRPLLRCLELPSSVGIVGGKPQRSLYFVGHQEDDVFFLDPHVVQPAFVEDGQIGAASGPRGTCPISLLDPCMVLCFLFFSQDELDVWEEAFYEIHAMSDFPMFSLVRSPAARAGGAAPPVGPPQGADGAGAAANAADHGGPAEVDVDDCGFDSD